MKEIREGMTFLICPGLEINDISMQIAETVLIKEDLTENLTKNVGSILKEIL